MNRRSGEETKRHILDVAQRVFVDHGYAGTSIRTIAGAAGISIGALYLYFRNKEELYLTLIRESLDEFSRRTEDALRDTASPDAALATVITMTIDYATTNREIILLQGRELGVGFGSEIKQDFFKKRRRLLEGIIEKGISDGIFRECDVQQAAKVVMNLLRGIVMSVMIEEDAIPLAGSCSSFILNGLLKQRESTT